MVDNLVPVLPAHKLGGFVDFLRFTRFFICYRHCNRNISRHTGIKLVLTHLQ